MEANPPAAPTPGAGVKGAKGPKALRKKKTLMWAALAIAIVLVLLIIVGVWWYLAHRRECNVDQDCGSGYLCIDGHCLTKGKANLEDK